MPTQAQTIADHARSYPPAPVVIDRPTNDLFDFVAACQELRRRYQDDLEAQVKQATAELADRHTRNGRRGGMGALVEAARWQVYYQRRRLADVELRALHPTGRLLEAADAHEDAELYRRREAALTLLLGEDAVSYDHLAPQVLADRERACRQQRSLVDEQAQPTRQLTWLRGLLGLLGQRHARQLSRDLAELDRQLHQVQAEIAWQQALLDAIQTRDVDRAAWLTQHQTPLLKGAAAVIVLTRRLLALANPPGCDRPVSSVDLDHPRGHDPLDPSGNHVGKREGAGVASTSVTPVAAGSADPPRQG
jgi:hypothetical protein